jgi:hypothetical protein
VVGDLAAVVAYDLAVCAVKSARCAPAVALVLAVRRLEPRMVAPATLTAEQVEQAYRWADDFMRDHAAGWRRRWPRSCSR